MCFRDLEKQKLVTDEGDMDVAKFNYILEEADCRRG